MSYSFAPFAVAAAMLAFATDVAPADQASTAQHTAPVCSKKGKSTKLPPVLSEASGIAVGSRPDIFWMHNDGRADELFAIDRSGKAVAVVRIDAKITDFESIDAGPCAGGHCLYIGDIGDNTASRSDVVVYRVREPVDGAKSVTAEALRARYPDGPHDAEALIVTRKGVAYIISKGDKGPIAVYRFSMAAAANAIVTLTRVRVLNGGQIAPADRVTDAAMSPDGAWVAVRTLGYIDFYRTADFIGNGKPAHRMDLSSIKEAQGEGVAFGSNARTVFISSEGGQKGKGGSFAELECGL